MEVRGNNRSVMSFEVLGGTRNTMMHAIRILLCPNLKRYGNLYNVHLAWDRTLQLLFLNEEFLVSVSHQLTLNT